MKLHHATVAEENIKLLDQEVNVLGPELYVEDCNIYSDCDNGALIIAGMKMVGGKFFQDSPLTNFHFENAHFLNVKFSGTFIGCDFGDWDDSERSSVSHCDYSDAILDGCRFLNCDMESIKLPKWPCFTLINPSVARSAVLSRQWPSKVGMILDIYTDNDPECVGICGDAQRLAKKNSLSIADFRQLLMTVPGMQIIE